MGGPGLGPPMEKIKNAAGQVQKYGVNDQYFFASLFHTTTLKVARTLGPPIWGALNSYKNDEK